ncbi:MarR family winged helix-turn-helix transcriptional regulator [Streptomonospora litoralis]|uniref:MarR family protein n=1 Tax=Streptomonospora litoralis TaxID=2498135 RepID=A0A4P6PXV5_9ACTN|nr:MarR family transcriptional regulator [Streptomonospora litoralis]QBI53106.1 MarR family protein [Streptomonospora litoralis]
MSVPHPDDGATAASEDDAQALLSAAALASFRLNGRFLAAAEELARPAGLTAAWWQVLGAVLHEPLPVADIARAMGMTRQGVQRVAHLLVEHGLAEYLPNPAHRRAKLLRPTTEGYAAVRRIHPAHRALALRLSAEMGPDRLASAVEALHGLNRALDDIAAEETTAPGVASPGRLP